MNDRIFVLIFGMAWMSCSPLPAQETACRPIINANKAQWQAPMVHDIKVMGSGFSMETIKLGNDLFIKTGSAWRSMPPAMVQSLMDMAAIEKSGLQLKDCKQVGTDTINSLTMQIYSFTTVVSDAPGGSGRGKVWIGKDGLPYRMESQNVKGTITYSGVTKPKIGN